MCDQFQKAIRRRTETHRAKRAEKEGIKILSEEGINQDTQSQYFDRFIDKVDKDLFQTQGSIENLRYLDSQNKSLTVIESPNVKNRLSTKSLVNMSLDSSDSSRNYPKRRTSEYPHSFLRKIA